MKRGFTLIEISIYISILSIVIVGLISTIISIFSINNRSEISSANYELLIRNFHEK